MQTLLLVGLLSSCCLADFFSVLCTPSLDLKPGEASQDFLLNPPHIHTDTLNCHDHDAGLQLECIPIDT